MIKFKKLPENVHEKISLLADLFRNDPNIVFGYLFGGLLRKNRGPFSDVDIAGYVQNPKKLDYLQLFSDITNTLGTDEVDLVILNSSPISLSGRILRNRKILIDKDPFLRHSYESLTLRKYFDFSARESRLLMRRYGITEVGPR